jgi:hypothetical protein
VSSPSSCSPSARRHLPVSAIGILLVLVGLVLFVLEVKIVSHGLLASAEPSSSCSVR